MADGQVTQEEVNALLGIADETLGAIEYPLTNVVKGSSVTTVNVTLDELKQKLPLIVNVHESTSRATNYVSCGQVVFE